MQTNEMHLMRCDCQDVCDVLLKGDNWALGWELWRYVTLCVRVQNYCFLCLYWCQFKLTVAMLIDRHADHINFVPGNTLNMYTLHLQAHETCIFVFKAHRTCTFSDKLSIFYCFPLFYPRKMREYLDKLSNHCHPGNIVCWL